MELEQAAIINQLKESINLEERIKRIKEVLPSCDSIAGLYFYGDVKNSEETFAKAMKAYAQLQADELPLICYDGTLFGSADEGFILTDKRIYLRDTKKKTGIFAPQEIVDVLESRTIIEPSHVLVFASQQIKPYVIFSMSAVAEIVALLRAWKEIVLASEGEENQNSNVNIPVRSAGAWWFMTNFLLRGRKITEVYANKNMLNIESYIDFFHLNKKERTIDITTITSISQEKKLAVSSIWLIILGVISLTAIVGIIPLLIGIFTLRDKHLKIAYQNQYANIPDVPGDDQMNDLMNYIKEHNPNVVTSF